MLDGSKNDAEHAMDHVYLLTFGIKNIEVVQG